MTTTRPVTAPSPAPTPVPALTPTPASGVHRLAAKDILAGSPGVNGSKPPQHSALETEVLPVVRAALSAFRAGVKDAVESEIRQRADEMVSAPVVDRLVAGWRTYTALIDAAKETVDHPGTTKLVDLGSTETTSTKTWTLAVTLPVTSDVLVDVPVVSVDFTLELVFRLHAAVATVRAGRITRIGDGRCDIRATFTAMHQQLGDHSEEVDLYDHLSFTPGILLYEADPEARERALTPHPADPNPAPAVTTR